MHKFLAALIVIVLLSAALYYYAGTREITPTNTDTSSLLSEPTDFAQIGIITAPSPASGQAEMSFSYLENGATTTRVLALDALSVCAAPNGAVPCMAMSVTFDLPFNGKRALIEGNNMGTSSILVRKLAVVPAGSLEYTPETGARFISWPNAITLIKACDASMVMQTHALDVFITRSDGTRVRTVEPVIDEIFAVTEEASRRCGAIPIATE